MSVLWPGTATAQQPVVLSPPNVRVVTGQLPPEKDGLVPRHSWWWCRVGPCEAGGAFLGGVPLHHRFQHFVSLRFVLLHCLS